ncbi:MAG: methyltransferase domain-containing protein, partial [Pseudomonadota bacterium]
MSHPFDFISELDAYDDTASSVHRLNQRYDHIVAPFKADIEGARVLDLGSHDGRWPYALAYAGAREVVGIEARPALIASFKDFPDDAHRAKVTLRQGDVFEVMEEMKRYKERFDVVAIYGLLYHTTEHYRLLLLAQAMQPKLIIVDSEFIVASDGPIIRFMREDVENELNTVARRQGHQVELVGTPSMRL